MFSSACRIRSVCLGLTVLALVGAGCGSDEPDSTGTGNAAGIDDVEIEVASIVEDLNQYWSQADSELGFDYVEVPFDRVSTGDDGVKCDRQEIEREEVEENAFVDSGCAEGITVAYDPEYVGKSLARAEGTIAHEWGHVIQAQALAQDVAIDLSLDPYGLPIDAELQADCFAGAWAAERGAADYEAMRADLMDAGDPHGTPIDDPESHGNPQQRAGAFDVGFDGGPRACIEELIDILPE